MTTERSKAQLSKNVLQMKFMQRSVLRIEQEQNEEERQRDIDDEHWVLDLPEYRTKESPFVSNQSYMTCEGLVFGRQSYQGFNAEIEKLMQAQNTEQELKASEEKEKQNSVSDIEMANRFSTLSDVIAKKFAKKRKRTDKSEDGGGEEPSKKKSFVKPPADD